MIIHLILDGRCPTDDTPLVGYMTSNVRVNLRSLKSDDKNLIFTRECAGCGAHPDLNSHPMWRLDPGSAAKVEAAREKLLARRKAS